ncbi:T9SS type A sorting domain-containing protein [bacterium SCSIO 12741]|nr:T9SS type A sorting domain-containing protein [bacterium SCSIO 12741]
MLDTRLLLILGLLLSTGLKAQVDSAYMYSFGGGRDDFGRDMELTQDNGFILVGSTSSFGAGNSDVYLVKTDSALKRTWSVALGHGHLEVGRAVEISPIGGGYVICGYTNSIGNGGYDAYVLGTDPSGKLLWERTMGGFDWDFAHDLKPTSDGGYLVVGKTYSFSDNGKADGYIFKIKANGDLEWEKNLGSGGDDEFNRIIPTRDGNFAICGARQDTSMDGNPQNFWLVKMDETGKILFDAHYSYPISRSGHGIIENQKGEFVMVGIEVDEKLGVNNEYVMVADSTGKFVRHIDVLFGEKTDEMYDIVEGSSLYFTMGHTNSHGNGEPKGIFGARTISIDFNMQLVYGPVVGEGWYDKKMYTVRIKDGRRYGIGDVGSFENQYRDMGVIEYRSDTNAWRYGLSETYRFQDTTLDRTVAVENHETQADGFQLYPNPVSDRLIIQAPSINGPMNFHILDIRGSILEEYEIDFQGEAALDVSRLSQGSYILVIDGHIPLRFQK